MQLIVLGLNHKTAPVEIRERFNFSQDRTVRVLRRLRNNDNLNEADADKVITPISRVRRYFRELDQ